MEVPRDRRGAFSATPLVPSDVEGRRQARPCLDIAGHEAIDAVNGTRHGVIPVAAIPKGRP